MELTKVLIFGTLVLLCRCSGSGGHIVAIFTDDGALNSTINNHLVVHKNTGVLYVGAVNHLYKLNPNLNLLDKIDTISKKKIPETYDECDSCPVEPVIHTLPQNVNKVLAVDYNGNQLIVCGTENNGSCCTFALNNTLNRKLICSSERIVPTDEVSSAAAFIGPGPISQPNSSVLYVASTYSEYSDGIPAVSSRSLNPQDKFSVVKSSGLATDGAQMHIRMRSNYSINYIYGFSSEGFSYFLTTQRKDDITLNSSRISKLVRVCQNDLGYFSYTEIPIDCVSESGVLFNLVQAAYVGKPGSDLANNLGITASTDVLFAVFATEGSQNSANATAQSGLCVYSLVDIRRKFQENIERCFQGKGRRGLGFITEDAPCVSTNVNITDDFCGSDVNTPLGGQKPVVAMTSTVFPTLLTSVAVVSTGIHTVAFLGTMDGHLKKVLVTSGKTNSEYDDLVIDNGQKVHADMIFDNELSHIYVMTDRKVSKVVLHNCSEYTTCSPCTGASDPYCGWCYLHNMCTTQENCQNTSRFTEPWISYNRGECTTIKHVVPNQLQISFARMLTVNIDPLPARVETFFCSFQFHDGRELNSYANLTSQGFRCYSPPTSVLPQIPHGQNSITALFSVRVLLENGSLSTNLATTEFIFYDCNTYQSCTSCVSSLFPCDWCMDKYRCTYDTQENCRNDVIVSGLSRDSPSLRPGPGFCPRFFVHNNASPEILIPDKSQYQVEVKLENVAFYIMYEAKLSCVYAIEGRVFVVRGQYSEGVLRCDPFMFKYDSNASSSAVTFGVTSSGHLPKPLDNMDNVRITIFRCESMADNCGMCLTMDPMYNCGWCQRSRLCQTQGQCNGTWLNRNATCADIKITSFSPSSGPLEGGTNVTITGINFGRTVEDVFGGVIVANTVCDPYPHLYETTHKIVCRLRELGTNQTKHGLVLVQVGPYKAVSITEYRFVDPKIQRLVPTKGPLAGGTKVSIYGENLDAGSSCEVLIGQITCTIILRESHVIQCRTGGGKAIGENEVSINFDESFRRSTSGFYYVEDPKIRLESDKPVKSIVAGGLLVTIKGSNFAIVNEIDMFITYNRTNYKGPCSVTDNTTIVCITPTIYQTPDFTLAEGDGYVPVDFGFVFDNVWAPVQNASEGKGDFHLHLYPNPKFLPFTEGVKNFSADYLTLEGTMLNSASEESSFVVTIGNSFCNLVSLSKTQLVCMPPAKQPPDDTNQNLHSSLVKVAVGMNWEMQLGRLIYDTSAE